MVKFNIYHKKTRYFFRCRVFPGKKEMYAYYLEYVAASDNKSIFTADPDFTAIVMPYECLDAETSERRKNIGEVLFYRGGLGMGVIAHEMLHCAMWHDRLIEGNSAATYGPVIGDDEERLAYTLTYYTRAFVNRSIDLGLWE